MKANCRIIQLGLSRENCNCHRKRRLRCSYRISKYPFSKYHPNNVNKKRNPKKEREYYLRWYHNPKNHRAILDKLKNKYNKMSHRKKRTFLKGRRFYYWNHPYIRESARKWKLANKEKRKGQIRQQIKEMRDWYIRYLLTSYKTKLKGKDIPRSLVETKRELLKLRRLEHEIRCNMVEK
jgi:hypothetical protein